MVGLSKRWILTHKDTMKSHHWKHTARNFTAILACGIVCSVVTSMEATELPYQVSWIRQLGTTQSDYTSDVAVGGTGAIYVSGATGGSLAGNVGGEQDAFVSRYSSAGELVWTKQTGMAGSEYSSAISADDLGNVFVAGRGSNTSLYWKFDEFGELQWASAMGDASRFFTLSGPDIVADGFGNALTNLPDQSIRAINSDGEFEFLASYDDPLAPASLTVDSAGNVLVGVTSWGPGSGPFAGFGLAAVLRKIDQTGTTVGLNRLTALYESYNETYVAGVASDSFGNAFIAGSTKASLGGQNQGMADAFVAKYDSSLQLAWIKLLGTSASDFAYDICTDSDGNIFIVCNWNGVGLQNEVTLSKLTPSGELLWTTEFNSDTSLTLIGSGISIAADADGSIYIAGSTTASLGGENAGGYDAVLFKLVAVPEPASIGLAASAAFALCAIGRDKSRVRSTRGNVPEQRVLRRDG